MNTPLTAQEKAKYGLVAAGTGSALLIASQPVSAQTSPIEDMATEVALVTGIADAVIPLAIGTTVFAIGAEIVKRFAFS